MSLNSGTRSITCRTGDPSDGYQLQDTPRLRYTGAVSYLKRFAAMVKALEGNSKITGVRYTKAKPAAASRLAAVREQHALGPDVLALWSETDGLKLRWKSKGASGLVEIPALATVFGDWKDTVYFDDTPKSSKLRKLHPVDMFAFGNSACAALMLDGAKDPIVFVHELGEGSASMKMTFSGYLDALLVTRGFANWPAAVAADRGGKRSSEASALRSDLPSLFPDVDLVSVLKKPVAVKKPPAGGKQLGLLERVTNAFDTAKVKHRLPDKQPRNGAVVRIDGSLANRKKMEAALVAAGFSRWAGSAKQLGRSSGLIIEHLHIQVI